jgi:hypothetical protein
MWKHSSSWQDLGPGDHDDDDDLAQGADSVYGGRDASSESETTALLHRQHVNHVTLTVSRQGEATPGSVVSKQYRAVCDHELASLAVQTHFTPCQCHHPAAEP